MFYIKKNERMCVIIISMDGGGGGGVELVMGFGWGLYIFMVNYVNLRILLFYFLLDMYRYYNGYLNEDNLY